jgi:hypothetical protein
LLGLQFCSCLYPLCVPCMSMFFAQRVHLTIPMHLPKSWVSLLEPFSVDFQEGVNRIRSPSPHPIHYQNCCRNLCIFFIGSPWSSDISRTNTDNCHKLVSGWTGWQIPAPFQFHLKGGKGVLLTWNLSQVFLFRLSHCGFFFFFFSQWHWGLTLASC